MSDRTVFVGGISWKANEENLMSFFSTFGTVTDCKIIVDKNSNKSKGYGFVTFEDPEIAEKIKKSKDLNFMGKTMNASDAYRKNDGTKKPVNNIAGGSYDHPGYQSPPYSVPYGAIPIPYYVPSYNPISYVPYVYPYGYGWSPGTPDYYLYQPYDYEETYDEDDNGGDNGEGEIESGKGSKDESSGEENSDENAPNTANNTDSQGNTDNSKGTDTPGGTTENDKNNIDSSENNNQKVDG